MEASDLRSLRESIEAIFTSDRTVALWYSGGSDSRLLLEVMLETGGRFSVLRFNDGWTREQSTVGDAGIHQHRRQAFSYPALRHMLVGEGEEIALVSGYAVDADGTMALLVRDIVDDPKRCGMDERLLAKPQMRAAPAEFDVHIWGTRKDDRHWVVGDNVPLISGPEWKVGSKTFIAPLYEWTRERVRAALKSEYGVVVEGVDTGDLRCCTNCLRSARAYCPKVDQDIDGVIWDAEGNLSQVRGLMIDEK